MIPFYFSKIRSKKVLQPVTWIGQIVFQEVGSGRLFFLRNRRIHRIDELMTPPTERQLSRGLFVAWQLYNSFVPSPKYVCMYVVRRFYIPSNRIIPSTHPNYTHHYSSYHPPAHPNTYYTPHPQLDSSPSVSRYTPRALPCLHHLPSATPFWSGLDSPPAPP